MHVLTSDGSSTLFSEKYGECYHSRHGAIQESLHVFIAMGLNARTNTEQPVSILEMGLGTGLNALLTALQVSGSKVHYVGIEAEPIAEPAFTQLNYPEQLDHPQASDILQKIHLSPWNETHEISPGFQLEKVQARLQDFKPRPDQKFDLVYFDAFAPTAQPELWTEEIFQNIYHWCQHGAILTTYSAKGDVRRAMLAAGFQVEKLPGPPGKREMLRARKAEN